MLAAWVRRNWRQLVSVCRRDAVALEDPADRRGADAVAECEQLALDSDISPARVLPRHAHQALPTQCARQLQHESGEHGPVCPVDTWPRVLAAQHRDLVSQNE